MTEFKVTKKLSGEIASVKKSGNALNDDYTKIPVDDVKTLDTAVHYIEQHKQIKELIGLYKELVLKDVKDMNSMVKEVEALDETIASAHSK